MSETRKWKGDSTAPWRRGPLGMRLVRIVFYRRGHSGAPTVPAAYSSFFVATSILTSVVISGI